MIAGAVALLTILTFLPALRGEFLNWDDDKLLTENMGFRGFWPANVRWMFSTMLLGNYQPLTWLSYAFDYCIWGMNPFGYRLTNVLLHSTNAVLVFVLASQLLGRCLPDADSRSRVIGAAAAALFFALHPLRVESVAWATERKDVLSSCLLLACVIAYLNYAGRSPSGRGYYASVILLGLSLLAKVWGMTLPIVLLILDVYPLRRFGVATAGRRWSEARRLLAEKFPFILFAAAAAMKAYGAQTTRVELRTDFGWAEKIAQSCYSIIFYIWKTVMPVGLTPLHQRPIPLNAFAPRYLICAASVVIITVALIGLRRRVPALLCAWLIYLVVLTPVAGWVPVGPQIVAERYTYLACIPFAMLLAGAIASLPLHSTQRAGLSFAAVATLIAVLGVATWRYCGVWHDSRSLWERVLAVEPDSWAGHNNMGLLLLRSGDLSPAREHFERAEAVFPNEPLVQSNLAVCLAKLGQTEQAVVHFKRGAAVPNARTSVLLMIADGLLALGRFNDSRDVYEQLLRRDPNDPDAHTNLAIALDALGESSTAITHLERAIALYEAGEASDKTYHDASIILAAIYERRGDSERAAELRRRSIGDPMLP